MVAGTPGWAPFRLPASITFRRFALRRVFRKTVRTPRSRSGTLYVLVCSVPVSSVRLSSSAAVLFCFCLVTAISFPVAVADRPGPNAWPIVASNLDLCWSLNFADRYDLGFNSRQAAIFAPTLHELPAPGQHVAA